MRTDSRKGKVEESCQSAGKKELSAERKCVLLCRKFFSVRRSRCDTVTTKTAGLCGSSVRILYNMFRGGQPEAQSVVETGWQVYASEKVQQLPQSISSKENKSNSDTRKCCRS